MAILMMVEKQGIIKAKEIANILEVSERTVYRDIDCLCEAGFPLYAVTGPKGGIRFTEGYKLGLDTGNETSIADVLRHLPNIPDNAGTALTIEKGLQALEGLLQTTAASSESMKDRIIIDDESWWGEAADPFDIRRLMNALWNQQSLTIHYAKTDGIINKRTVNPYGLILKHTVWYLVAYCQSAGEIRTFRCDRLADIQVLETKYWIPGTFDLAKHWQQSVQNFKESTIQASQDYLVKVEIPAAFIDQLENQAITWNNKHEGMYQGTLSFHGPKFAKEELLKIIGFVKVLAPEAMVTYARETLQHQLDNYPPF